jgi:hypothetical protein
VRCQRTGLQGDKLEMEGARSTFEPRDTWGGWQWSGINEI